jgi:hypothetical protein
MTEATVREFAHFYKDAVKLRGLAGSQEDSGLDKRLSALAAEVIAGRRVEVSWAAFRIVHFPGVDDLEAAGELRRMGTPLRRGCRFRAAKPPVSCPGAHMAWPRAFFAPAKVVARFNMT